MRGTGDRGLAPEGERTEFRSQALCPWTLLGARMGGQPMLGGEPPGLAVNWGAGTRGAEATGRGTHCPVARLTAVCH